MANPAAVCNTVHELITSFCNHSTVACICKNCTVLWNAGTVTGWKSCADDDGCARLCIRKYMSRYETICKRQLGKSTLDCFDYGRMQNGGPYGCGKSSTLKYVKRMREKCSLHCDAFKWRLEKLNN